MSTSLPSYESTLTTPPPSYVTPLEPTFGSRIRTASPSPSVLTLPQYTANPTTEPHTLSRTCFTWGFLCPLLWIIAVAILFIDLRYEPDLPVEGEGEQTEDAQVKRERDAQIVAESIGIIRKAEIRWSRYCAVALGIETVVILVIVGVIVAASTSK
ncbi:hypothetical protein NliqN6_4546 [Naganishia liquefaciens]|uniref:Uncharacterized protein n=1 Tax=Naganishia liquefaciens TaxID=104408 RepID=A0A8H3TXU1_9TREE|nr:hypothetical protein NliqN6_4546 [Naganishia liquefaciens]